MISATAAVSELEQSVVEGRKPSIDAVVGLIVSHQMVSESLEECERYFAALPPCEPLCKCPRHRVSIVLRHKDRQ